MVINRYLKQASNIEPHRFPGGGGGGLPYKKARDARQKFYIKPLKETNLGVAQAFFDP